MQSSTNRIAQFTEQEDNFLESVETTQTLLSILLSYIQAHVHDLNKETALAVILAVHHIFADCDRKLIELRLENSFSSTAAEI